MVGVLTAITVGLVWWLIQAREVPDPGGVPADNSDAVDALLDAEGYKAALVAAESAAAPSDPDAMPLPSVDQATQRAAQAFFDTDGAPLLEFLVVVEGSWASLDEEACDVFAAQLDRVSQPPELGILAEQAPDPVARDTFANLVSFTVKHVAVCGGDQSLAAEVAWHWAVVVRRLAELGVVFE